MTSRWGRVPLLLRLTVLLLPADVREEVLGDLLEHWRGEMSGQPRSRRVVWLWRQPLAAAGLRLRFGGRDRGRRGRFREQVRYTLKRLRRAPGYSLLVVGLLGLGLGVVGATYTVLRQVVLRPLPVTDQERLVVAWTDHTVRGADHYPVNATLFQAAERGGIPALGGVAAIGSYGTGRVAVEGPDGTMPLAWARVLGDFFGVLGAEPAVGRALLSSDDVPNPTERVAVISHDLWMRSYGGSTDVLGRSLPTRHATYTVVGVMPPEFDYPPGADVWSPTRADYPEWDAQLPRLELDLVGRLSPGATPEMVAAQLAALSRSTPELEGIYRGTVPVVRPFEAHVLGDLRQILLVLFLGGLLVLVVVSLDVVNIVLVRAIGERRQAEVRKALGMDPRWVLSEAVIEGAVLGGAAAVLGGILGSWAVRLLVPLAPGDLGRLDLVRGLDPSAYLLVVAGTLVAVAGSVILPRWRVARIHARLPFRSMAARSTTGGSRVREVVVAGQVGIAVWVLVTGALLVRTVANLQRLEPGFDPDNLTLVALDHPGAGVLGEPGESQALEAAIARLEQNDGVLGATPIQMAPLPGAGAWQAVLFKGGQSPERALEENAYVFMEFVEPDFASILDVPVLHGRVFDETDDARAPGVVVVNQAAARMYWPGEDAIGQTIRVRFPGHEDDALTVIGVVGDTRYGDLTELKPTAYFPVLQMRVFRAAHILVRTTGPTQPVLDLAREALRAEAPRYRAVSVVSVSSRLDEPLVRPRFAALLLGVLALTALVIAVLGLYSTMAFLVHTRRREIGIRLACGSTPRDVGELVVRRGLMISALGTLGGGVIAMASAGLFETLLYGVVPTDVTSLASGVLLALAPAGFACLAPALRAASTDPAVVLRAD